MSEPVHEMSRPCLDLIRAAAQAGDPAQEGMLREQLGIGHGDLLAITDQLRAEGLVTQPAPGEWTVADAVAEEDVEPRVAVSLPDAAQLDEDEVPVRDDRAGARALAGLLPEATVRLTRAIALALDANALGKLVLAGLDDLEAGETFRMEIVP